MSAPPRSAELKSASANLCRYAIPECDRIEIAMATVLLLSGDAERGELDVHGRPFAAQIYADLLGKAIAGGFKDAAILAAYGKAKAFTSTGMELATDMVRCIGGHDAVLDICDLHTFKPADCGALQ
ncbi:hypothetical protein [Janthinobacterium sp. UMAB-56]|uniref:hypothetical protein n=1 Tax=Janthinobacterium sp. UMAB-56 TaxID=1365361 RepID=UPI001C592BF6|nr:hypothetical protein [Janthinobacterium sp. UMAB-56]